MESSMEQMEEEKKRQYEKYVKEVTPTHNLWLQMLKAFIMGGIICTLGQAILNYGASLGLDKQDIDFAFGFAYRIERLPRHC